jgi:hypothetical protein
MYIVQSARPPFSAWRRPPSQTLQSQSAPGSAALRSDNGTISLTTAALPMMRLYRSGAKSASTCPSTTVLSHCVLKQFRKEHFVYPERRPEHIEWKKDDGLDNKNTDVVDIRPDCLYQTEAFHREGLYFTLANGSCFVVDACHDP